MNIIKIFCGFALTGLFLTLSQSPFDMSSLAWIGFLPLVFVSTPQSKKRWLFIIGYFTCLIYWLGNLYWLSLPTVIGYVTFCIYMAIYWPLLAISIRYFRSKNWSITFFLPILIVGFEAWQGWFLGGFSWRLLGHSMHTQPTIVQIADIFGVAGITFVIALVNGFVAEIMLEKPKAIYVKTFIVLAVLVSVFIYGTKQLDYYQTADLPRSPLIASIQTNEPITIAGIGHKSDQLFEQMISLSNETLQAEPNLIVWPETMVVDTLEHQYLNLRGSAYSGYYYNQAISAFAAKNKVQMVIGASGGITDYNSEKNSVALLNRTNAAYIYGADGLQNPTRYDKIHLVPFGEIVPFKYSAPWLYDFFMRFTPYPDQDFSLTPGTNFYTFDLTLADQTYSYAVIICYEDTLAQLVRKMAVNKTGEKRVNWLVNISNDGWFTWRAKKDSKDTYNKDLSNRKKAKKIYTTTELAQHAIIASFRAIETRVGIVRSVNTGISCFIEPSGRIKDSFIAGTLPKPAMKRKGVSGWIVDYLTIDPRVSFFSRFGQWLEYLCGIMILPILMLSFRKISRVNSHLEGFKC